MNDIVIVCENTNKIYDKEKNNFGWLKFNQKNASRVYKFKFLNLTKK